MFKGSLRFWWFVSFWYPVFPYPPLRWTERANVRGCTHELDKPGGARRPIQRFASRVLPKGTSPQVLWQYPRLRLLVLYQVKKGMPSRRTYLHNYNICFKCLWHPLGGKNQESPPNIPSKRGTGLTSVRVSEPLESKVPVLCSLMCHPCPREWCSSDCP